MPDDPEKLTAEQQQEFLEIMAEMQPREGESYADWRRRYAHFEKTGETELPDTQGGEDEGSA